MDLASMIREANSNFWAEEDEIKAGVHPYQVKERVEKYLHDRGMEEVNITFLMWNMKEPNTVRVWINDKEYGDFNYDKNEFEVLF